MFCLSPGFCTKRKEKPYSGMAKKYKIGKFEFDTYEEYVRGMADVKKIYKITHSVDIYDPDTALRLYQNIRAKKIRFYSKIGRQFFVDIADIVAENTQNIMEEQIEKKEPKNVDLSKNILGIICLVAAIACFVWYFWSDYTNHRGNQANDYLKQLREESSQEDVEMISNDTFFLEDAPELAASAAGVSVGEGILSEENGTQLSVLPEFQAILKENENFAGWITIEGTKIDYPVVLTRGDSDYYLNHNLNGEEDINGTLFMDARTNLTDRSTNIIIYGHNMKSGQMFGGLKNYLKEDYFLSHKQVTFDTIYEKGTYEIFAVCLAKVQYRDENTFRYYDFIQAHTEEEFNEFLQNIAQLSVFMDQDLPVYGEQLITLSTCNNYTEDGRLFLVARKCRDAE